MEPERPRVSVILPVYNDESHLPQAVESVLAQRFGSWEALIVDDGSTDGTPAVARAFAERDPRVQVLHPGRNVGAVAARELALGHARGQLIALLDSDDYFLEGFLERGVALFDEALAAGRRPAIVAVNGYIHAPEGLTDQLWSERFPWVDEIDLDRLVERNYIIARAMVDRAAAQEVGGFSEECSVRHPSADPDARPDEFRYATSDDHDLWLRLVEAGYEVLTTREPLAVYRYGESGRSRSPWVVADATARKYQRALDRGALDPQQRRIVRRNIRHARAIIARGQLDEALRARRGREAVALAPGAALSGAVAFLQAPSRWGEWAGELLGRRQAA